MQTLNKAELAQELVNRLNLTPKDVLALVHLCFEEMAMALSQGHTLTLSGFGKFTLRQKVARPGRNPKTGEPKVISARTVVTFKPSDKLLFAIQSGSRP